MFAEDRAGWTATSVRMRRARLESGGKFKISGLLPGRYYVVAASRERVMQPGDIEPSYFEAFAKDAMQTIYDQVLTPDQREKVDRDGYINGKDLTPGQQGILMGYLQDMMSLAMGQNMGIGKVTLDRANHKFSIEGKGWDEPADPNDPYNQALNRRVEIRVYPPEQ